MATRKSQPQRSSAAKSTAAAGTTKAGALPPYGVPIRDAIARGDANEMKQIAASTRKYLRDLGAAVDKLDKALGKTKG
jgi:hypothetical protein